MLNFYVSLHRNNGNLFGYENGQDDIFDRNRIKAMDWGEELASP